MSTNIIMIAQANQIPSDVLIKALNGVDTVILSLADSDLVNTHGSSVLRELRKYRVDMAIDIAKAFV